jgi:2'-5' RNA ligase
MSTQILLPGIEPAPTPDVRLFFAVLPDPDAAGLIAQRARRLRADHRLRGMPIDTERLHLSLQGLGDYVGVPQALVALACRAAARVACPAFTVHLDRALSFSGRSSSAASRTRAFVLRSSDGVAGLTTLHQALADSMQELGLPRPVAGPTPHTTLLYDTQSVAEHAVEPVTWTAREFVLVCSHIGMKKPYLLFDRWVLRD